jgi:TolA-binding protein
MEFYDDDIIKEFLDGSLDKEQSLLIEKKIKEEDAYAKEISLHQSIIKGLKKHELPKLDSMLHDFESSLAKEDFFDNIHQEIQREITQEKLNANNFSETKTLNKTPIIGLFSYLKLFAAAAAIFAGVFFLFPRETVSPLFTEHFSPHPDLISDSLELFTLNLRKRTDQEKNKVFLLQKEGIDLYNKQAYTKAIAIFEDGLQEYPQSDKKGEIKFYLAVAYLANHEAVKAIPILERISKEEGGLPTDDELWFLSLAYLYQNENDKAKSSLLKISSSSSYSTQVSVILKGI